MMEYSSPKTLSSNHNSFISTHHHLNPTYSTTRHHSAAAAPMFGATAPLSFNLKNEEEDEEVEQVADDRDTTNSTSREYYLSEKQEEEEIPKKPLFEKPLTPSDVGKLNRLVIPKQHAERYFPMNGRGGGGDSNGLLLSFEDETGKSWRFRYSYWNSSQSYVLTKGWSRFVKEKKLDAGDVVVFGGHREDAGRLFIGWRRRNNLGGGRQVSGKSPVVVDGGGGWGNKVFYQPYNPSQINHQLSSSSSLQYQNHDNYCHHAGSVIENQTTVSNGNPKRLRLFGVNLEWHGGDESEPLTPDGSAVSSQGQAHPYNHHQYYSNMDINFSGGDVNRQG